MDSKRQQVAEAKGAKMTEVRIRIDDVMDRNNVVLALANAGIKTWVRSEEPEVAHEPTLFWVHFNVNAENIFRSARPVEETD